MSICDFKCPELPEGFTVTFHAGFLGTPENTVESVKTACEMNGDIVEFDVTFRKDGTPVIIHKSLAEDNEGDLLDEALAVVASHPSIKVNLDLKSTLNLPAVDELVRKYGLEQRVFYTGVGEDWVEDVKANSFISYYLNHTITPVEAMGGKAAQKLAGKIKELGAIGLNSNFLTATQELVEVMHENGIPVSLWTPNDEITIKKVLKCAPDNMTTRRPDLAKKIIG